MGKRLIARPLLQPGESLPISPPPCGLTGEISIHPPFLYMPSPSMGEGVGGGATVGVSPHPNFPRQEGRTLEPDTYPYRHPMGSGVKIGFRLCSEIGSRLGGEASTRGDYPCVKARLDNCEHRHIYEDHGALLVLLLASVTTKEVVDESARISHPSAPPYFTSFPRQSHFLTPCQPVTCICSPAVGH
jgi:hypothetical protein